MDTSSDQKDWNIDKIIWIEKRENLLWTPPFCLVILTEKRGGLNVIIASQLSDFLSNSFPIIVLRWFLTVWRMWSSSGNISTTSSSWPSYVFIPSRPRVFKMFVKCFSSELFAADQGQQAGGEARRLLGPREEGQGEEGRGQGAVRPHRQHWPGNVVIRQTDTVTESDTGWRIWISHICIELHDPTGPLCLASHPV